MNDAVRGRGRGTAAGEPPLADPGVRFPPPLLFVGGLGLAAFLESRWPLPPWPGAGSTPLLLLAYGPAVAGALWIAWGIVTFRRARTSVLPGRPASSMVTAGPYRFGRNPMYLGMSAMYWGVTLWMGSVWPVLLFPVVIALLVPLVIRREERYLESAFGEDYLRYRAAVGRWFSA